MAPSPSPATDPSFSSCLVGVFSFLPPKDLAQCSEVCRTWKIVNELKDKELWKPHAPGLVKGSRISFQQAYGARYRAGRLQYRGSFHSFQREEQNGTKARHDVMIPRIEALREVMEQASSSPPAVADDHNKLIFSRLCAIH